MSTTLITCTGGRPEAFALLEAWMVQQTYRNFEWIVVDDHEIPTQVQLSQTVIRPTARWSGMHTLTRNLDLAMHQARGDNILFIEDDEVYLPDYVETMVSHLETKMLVGETPARYYNVALRTHRTISSGYHASLCQTGIKTACREMFLDICRRANPERPFVDLELWRLFGRKGILFEGNNCVSIKGMPGRKGIGVGHTKAAARWEPDPELGQLTFWIGAWRAIRYAQFKCPSAQPTQP